MNTNLIQFLSTLKNYSILHRETLTYKYSNQVLEIVKCLYSEGIIQSYSLFKKDSILFINLIIRYYFNKPIFKNLKIISTPSKSYFLDFQGLTKISDKKFIIFISTHKGILTLSQCKKNIVGGKLLFCC